LHWTEIFTIIFIIVVLTSTILYFVKKRQKGETGCGVSCGGCPTTNIDIKSYYRKHYKSLK